MVCSLFFQVGGGGSPSSTIFTSYFSDERGREGREVFIGGERKRKRGDEEREIGEMGEDEERETCLCLRGGEDGAAHGFLRSLR